MGVRRFGCLVLLLSFFFSIQIFSQSKRVPLPRVDAENGRLDQQMEFVPGSYLVEFDDQLPSFAQASGAAATVQARVGARRDLRLRVMEQENEARASRGLDRVSERDVIVHDYGKLFNGLSARLQASAAEDLRRVPGIKAVWPQRLMQASVLPDAGVQPQLPGVAEQLAYTGRGTVIAVIDTGIDYRHPDLGGCLGPGCKVIGGYDFANRDSDPLDGEGHGTHVAGIAAANGQMRGVAPDAKLLAVKVLSDQGSGSDGDVIAGIEWAVANGADVINLSLGGPPWPENDPVSRVVEKAVDSGVVVVASAGNSGPAYYTIGSPGIAQKAITVGASEDENQVAEFSSRGPSIDRFLIKPDLLAPGVDIRSTVLTGKGGEPYGKKSGTSMAAPYIAGAAALLLERSPDWSPLEIKHGLVAHARSLSIGTFVQGAGHVDLEKALATQTTISEGPLGLGLLYPSGGDLSRLVPVEFTNSSARNLVYDLQLEGDPPAGLVVALGANRLVLSPGQKASVDLGIAAYNALLLPKDDYPCDYSTTLVARSETDVLRLPIAVVKGAVLNVALRNTGVEPGQGPAPEYVYVHDGKGHGYVKGREWVDLGTFRLVLPPGSYDAFAYFPSPQVNSIVLFEGIALDSEYDLELDAGDAVHELKFRPRYPGNPQVSEYEHGVLVHKTSGLVLPFTFWGTPLRTSSISDRYSLEMTVLGLSPPDAVYTVPSSLVDGVSKSQILENDPEDFCHLLMDHGFRRQDGKFSTWVQLALGTTRFMWGINTGTDRVEDDGSRHWYLGVPRTPMSAIPALNEVFMQLGNKYESAGWHAISRSEVRSHPHGDPGVVLSSGSLQSVPAGIGPYYWFGRFTNSPDLIKVEPSAGVVPLLVIGQLGDSRSLSMTYELRKDGITVKSGLMAAGHPRASVIPVEPGPHNLVLTEVGIIGRHPAMVTCDFDTTRTDPNPPYIVGFRLLKGTEATEVLSATQPRQLVLRIADDTALGRVAVIYSAGDKQENIPVTHVGGNEYRADLPLLGDAPFADLAIVLEDASGNSVRFETRLPRGFPDLTVKASGQDLRIGRTVGRQVTVSNRGYDSTESGITITEVLPEGVEFVNATGGSWTCNAAGRTLTCQRAARLGARTQTSFTVYLQASRNVSANVHGTITAWVAEDEDHGNDSFDYSVAATGTSWWTELGPGGGEVYTLAAQPGKQEVMYAGTRGQVWRSENSGDSWAPLTRDLPDAPVSAIAVDPTRPDVIYAGTDGFGIYKSTDRGSSWVSVSSGLPAASATVLVIRINPRHPDTIYAGFARGAERSTDGGKTWEALAIPNSGVVSDFAVHPSDSAVVYAGTEAGVFCSRDGGSVWSLSLAVPTVTTTGIFDSPEDTLFHLKYLRLAFDPHDPSTLFATTKGGLYFTTDGGAAWQWNPLMGARLHSNIAVAPDSERTIYLARDSVVGRISKTATVAQYGQIGTLRNSLIDDLLLSADGSTLYAATRSGVYRSQNKGDDWTPAGRFGLGATSLVFDPSQPSLFYLLTDEGIMTGSGGSDWTFPSFFDLRARQQFFVIDPLRPGTFYAGGPGLFKSTDGGEAWKSASQGLPAAALDSVSALALDPRNGTTLYLGTSHPPLGDGEGVFRSTDGAASWQPANAGLPAAAGVSCLSIEPTSGSVYAGTISRESSGGPVFALYRSSNSGGTWNLIGSGLPNGRINMLVFGGTAIPGATFIGTEGHGIYRSDDGGLKWTPINQGLSSGANIRALAVGPSGAIFAAAYGAGVFRSTDAGRHWEIVDQGLNSKWVTNLVLDPSDPRNLYVTTSNGLYSLTLSPDFSLSASRTGKVLTGGAAVWSLNLVNSGSASNSDPIELEFKVPAGLRVLRSAGSGWTCTDAGTSVHCMNQARVEPGTGPSPLALTFEVDEQAESSLTAEIRADVSEDLAPQNDIFVDLLDVQPAEVSRIPFFRTDRETFAGIALSSMSESRTEVVLTALDKEGKLLDQPRNPLFLALEPGTQLARLTSELFGDANKPATDGWLRIAADQPVGTTYQFGGTQQLDGGIAVHDVSRTLYFTRVCEGPAACWGQTGQTLIGLSNPGSKPVTVRAVLFSPELGLPRQAVYSIPAKGNLAGSLSELFELSVSARPIRAGYVEVEVIEDEGGIVGSEQIELTETQSLVSLPGQPVGQALALYSAQLADVPGLFTRLQLVNSGPEPRIVRLRALGDDGEPIANQTEFALEGSSATELDCGSELDWLPGKTRIGTLLVESDGPGILGDVLFGGRQGETAAALPLQAVPHSVVHFGQVANGMGLYTGLALFNPQTQPVQVSILVTKPDGDTGGELTLTLEPGARLSKLVSDLLPITSGQIGGAVTVSASHPIFVQQLFGGANILSAVPPLEVR